MSIPVFSTCGDFYNLLYHDKNYNEETYYIERLIQKYGAYAKTVLELGSGTGVHAKLLADKGFTIHGIERSPEMLSIANQLDIPGVTFQLDDIAKFSVAGRFDVCLALFHVISYITENETLLSVFKNAASHLEAGGLFIFDVWHTPAVYVQQPEKRVKTVENDEVRITRTALPQIHYHRNVIDVNYEFVIENKTIKTSSTSFEKHTSWIEETGCSIGTCV